MKKLIHPNCILLLIFALLFILPGLYGAHLCMERSAHYAPAYEKCSLKDILCKTDLTEEDYLILFYQTGLAPCAVDEIRLSAANPQAAAERLKALQERFFAPVEVTCSPNSPISREERISSPKDPTAAFAPCHDSYILITFASHTAWWRNGHAALIVDAAADRTLEAVVLGSNSTFQNLSKWSGYPSFILLRLKGLTPSLAASIAATAMNQLRDVPYRLTAGLWGRQLPEEEPLSGTQCAHLVYSAFRLNGIDLMPGGGLIVTPKRLSESPRLEIVQIYGFSPADYLPHVFP